jgi:hypothetical protein
VRRVVQPPWTTLAAMSDQLQQLLFEHRALALERDAAEAGSEERAALDAELLAMQRRILFWSDDDNADHVEREAG